MWLTEWDHIENESEKLFEWASKAIASERPDIALVIGTRWLENFAFFSKEKKTLYDELYEIKNEFERDNEIHRLDQRFCKACEKAINAIDEAIPYPNVSEEVKNDIAPRLESLDTPMSRTISYYCSKFYGLPFRVKAFCLPEKETLKALEQRLDTDFNNTALIKEKYRLLLKMGLTDEAEEFVEENIDNYDVADAYVQDLFNAKRLDKLISVLLDITDPQYETGTRPTRRWLELLAQCQQSFGVEGDVIDTYRRLFILSNGKMDYYHILKQKVAEQDWPEFLEQMVQQTRFPNYYTNGKDDYAELLILEGRFEDLQQWIRTNKFDLGPLVLEMPLTQLRRSTPTGFLRLGILLERTFPPEILLSDTRPANLQALAAVGNFSKKS